MSASTEEVGGRGDNIRLLRTIFEMAPDQPINMRVFRRQYLSQSLLYNNTMRIHFPTPHPGFSENSEQERFDDFVSLVFDIFSVMLI